jgi:hypothetical protein
VHEARLTAVATVRAEGERDPAWVQSQCTRLCEVIEHARARCSAASAASSVGPGEIRERYSEMGKHALTLIEQVRDRAE